MVMVALRSKPSSRRRYDALLAFASRNLVAGVIILCLLLYILFLEQPERNEASATPSSKPSVQPPSFPGIDGQECRYEGHCGIGTTCGVDTTSSLGGRCKRYDDNAGGRGKNNSPCVKACLHVLEYEEYMRFPAKVVLKSSHETFGVGRPYGCVLKYQRQERISKGILQPAEPYAWPDFTLSKYLNATLSQRIVRIDPILESKETDMWMALCYEPCTATYCTKGFVCSSDHKVCIRDDAYWTPTPALQHDMVIVSAASDEYLSALKNLASSLLYWAPEHRLVVYNLGFSQEYIAEIESWTNVLEVKWLNGIPQHYPEHVRTDFKEYAWKPLAINESLAEYGSIFWLDAGSTVVGPIDEVERITRQSGIFLVKGQDTDMKPMSSPLTYQYFGYDKETFQGGPHYAGNTQAYLSPSKYVDTIVISNAKCALSADCIAPSESHLGSHRYDQTSLSILSYRHDDLLVPHYTYHLAAGRDQLNDNLDQISPLDISYFITWTSRGSDLYYMEKGLLPKSDLDHNGGGFGGDWEGFEGEE